MKSIGRGTLANSELRRGKDFDCSLSKKRWREKKLIENCTFLIPANAAGVGPAFDASKLGFLPADHGNANGLVFT